jgi:hypothetical protein
MTDRVNDGFFENLFPLLSFMLTTHTDPVDRLVARALNLRWNAYAGHHSLPKDTALSGATLGAAIFANFVLSEVQKQRHYDVLVPIVEAFKAEHGDSMAMKMGMPASLSIVEHIAHYESILDDCEKTVGTTEVELAIFRASLKGFRQPDFGDLLRDVVSHEVGHDYRPLRALHEQVGEEQCIG